MSKDAHSRETIFVQIASYRDPQCQWTVKDLFEKADCPERVFVGICWQFDKEEDKDCFEIPYPRPKQVRTDNYHYTEAKGLGWARSTAQALNKGEDYTLQIDAHMRFAKGWDTKLINELNNCPTPRAVLSTSLSGYTPPDTLNADETRTSFTRASKFGTGRGDDTQFLHVHGGLRLKTVAGPIPFPTPFVTGNFIFARTSIFDEIPIDPYMFFYGEEWSWNSRLWTHGYNIYQPTEMIVYHQWQREAQKNKQKYKTSVDNPNPRVRKRVLQLLGLQQSDDLEIIKELDKYGLGSQRSMKDYWEFAGIDPVNQTIEPKALQGKWPAYQPTKTETSDMTASSKSTKPRIYVQIASYRDPECQWTIKDMFDKASDPDRIFAGICWQYDPDEDADCFQVNTRPEQVRVYPVHWKDSQGVCWARKQTQDMWEGEEYTLVIDSHMRFAQGWDEMLLGELAQCDSPKAVITCHPPGYTPPNNLDPNPRCVVMRAKLFDQNGDIRCAGEFIDRCPEKPLHGAFIAAGFMFSKADIIREVPYDPYLYFNQEEMSLAVRFYTHGWDVYHSNSFPLYHYYNDQKSDKKRPMHWSDHKEWAKLQERSRKRFQHLVAHTVSNDPDVLIEYDKYGLGNQRSLADFEKFVGIDFKTRHVSERAMRCEFIEGLGKYKDSPLYIPEIDEGKQKPEGDGLLKPTGAAAAHMMVTTILPTGKEKNEGIYIPPSIYGVDNKPLRWDQRLTKDGKVRDLDVVRTGLPPKVLMINNYLEPEHCREICKYADSMVSTKLRVVDATKSTKDHVATADSTGRVTHHVDIDGISGDLLMLFTDIYTRTLAGFYDVSFEWYERPQILKYTAGGKYDRHADADHWYPETKTWKRSQDRDISVLLYLNEEYEGGELHFPVFDYRFKPKTGMLAAFPSDNIYLHAAEPTTSGLRYVIVSWAAVIGTPRVRATAPYASVFLRQKRYA